MSSELFVRAYFYGTGRQGRPQYADWIGPALCRLLCVVFGTEKNDRSIGPSHSLSTSQFRKLKNRRLSCLFCQDRFIIIFIWALRWGVENDGS